MHQHHLKTLITVLFFCIYNNLAAQDSITPKVGVYFGSAYFGSFGDGVYAYSPTVSFTAGCEFFWRKNIFSGLEYSTLKTTVTPEWEGFDEFNTRNHLIKLTSGFFKEYNKFIFRPAINAGLGIFYLKEFHLDNSSDFSTNSVTFYDDYSFAPMLGVDVFSGYYLLPTLCVGFTFGSWYTLQSWDVKAQGETIYFGTPDEINTIYHYKQTLVNLSAGIRLNYYFK